MRATVLELGLSSDRAARLEIVVVQLLVESRAREAVAGADGARVVVHHDGRNVYVDLTDDRLPLAPGESRRFRSRRLAGMGFVDQLHVGAGGEDGNTARCTVHLDAEELTARPSDLQGEVLHEEVPRVDDAVAATVEVRPAGPEDAVGIAQCVYRCYGYSYLDPAMYRPRRIRRSIGSGVMQSIVAVTGAGEVVGHIAMTFERPDDPVPEGGKLVVDPRFRGRHLAERLSRERFARAVELDLPGIWAECVTNHEFSQREFLAVGGVETGFLVGAQPATVHMEAVANAVAGRHSLLTMYLPVDDPGAAELWVPDRHGDLIERVGDRLGLQRTVSTEQHPGTGAAVTRLTVSGGIGLAEVRVERIGADLVDHLADVLDGLSSLDLDVVHLDLPLADPACAWAATEVESLGWFIGAWLPCAGAAGDVLRLQRLGGRPVDSVHVVCARPEGEEVRDHVVAEWRRVSRSGRPSGGAV